MKLSSKMVSFLNEIGETLELAGRGECLVIPCTAIAQHASGKRGNRSSEYQRQIWLREVLGATESDEEGVYRFNAFDLCDAGGQGVGFPETSVASATYWSGIAPGSHVCFLEGYYVTLKNERQGRAMQPMLTLTPLTDEQREAHTERVRKAAAKAAARSTARRDESPVGTDDSEEDGAFEDDEE